jgi:hypothetical protein
MDKKQLRKIVSLTALTSFIVMSWTGIVLYFVPQGKIAYWVNWKFWGLTKEQYGEIHTTFSVLFLVLMGFHIWLNWKAIVLYLKNKAKKFVFLTKEMLISLVITFLFFFGTLYYWAPFGTFLNALDDFKDGYEVLDTAPFPHAELLSLNKFCDKLNIDLEKAIKTLHNNGVNLDDPNLSLKDISKIYNTSPAVIYELIKNLKKPGEQKEEDNSDMEISGLGRMTVLQLSEKLEKDVKDIINKLKERNINATPDSKLKDLATKYNMLPMDIYDLVK